jgi:hypothetical protein
MNDHDFKVYISYAWRGLSEEIADKIDQSLQRCGITICRDKRDIPFLGSIKKFMEEIGKGDRIIVIVSDKYLRSPNCMFELVKIFENTQFRDRVISITLNDAKIFNPIERLEYIKYWEEKANTLSNELKTVYQANLAGIHQDMDNYQSIRNHISELTSILKDTYSPPPETHDKDDYSLLFLEIKKYINDKLEISGQRQSYRQHRIPFNRNRIFTNRIIELEKLANLLLRTENGSSITQAAIITGIGGVGKTQLAVEFCYQYGDRFEGVHWINTVLDIEVEIAERGREMGISLSSDDMHEQLIHTLNAWQESPNRLVILDNIEDPNELRKWLNKLRGLSILATSKRPSWGADIEMNICQIDELSMKESISLLQELSPRLKEEPNNYPLEEVAIRLGRLPLALDLAGRYFAVKNNLTPQKYLQMLDSAENILKHASLNEDYANDGSPTQHEMSLNATFMVSWKQLNKKRKIKTLARKLFSSVGHLAANVPITEDIFYTIADAELDEKMQDEVDLAIRSLMELGLVNPRRALHPLLAEFAKSQAQDEITLETLVKKVTSSDIEDSELRQHTEALARSLKNTKIDASALWENLGEYYYKLAEYPFAEKAFNSALEEEKTKNQNSNKDRIARYIHRLGNIQHALRNLEKAKELYIASKNLWTEKFGERYPGIEEFLNSLAEIHREIGYLDTAYSYGLDAIEIAEDNNPEKPRYYKTLGEIELKKDNLAAALSFFEQAMSYYESNNDEYNLSFANLLISQGEAFRRQDNYASAEDAIERAIHIFKISYSGRPHPDLAYSLWQLAVVLRDEGKLEESNVHLRNALNNYKTIFQPEHPYIQELSELLNNKYTK